MAENKEKFDELVFWARVKKAPALLYGKPSLLSLSDQLFGMKYAFSFYTEEDPMKYVSQFIDWYQKEKVKDGNGYACWWNHMLYTSGNNDARAFDTFFRHFERYLREVHNISLPEIEWPKRRQVEISHSDGTSETTE